MNREELDAWFAEADDVLADWWGSPDAAKWPPRDTDPVLDHPAVAYSDELRPLMDAVAAARRAAEQADDGLVRQMREAAERFAAYAPRWMVSVDPRPGTELDLWVEVFESRTSPPTRPGMELDLWEVFEGRTSSPPTRPEAMEHALRLRRERNTGPAPRVGLDGRRRRRGANDPGAGRVLTYRRYGRRDR